MSPTLKKGRVSQASGVPHAHTYWWLSVDHVPTSGYEIHEYDERPGEFFIQGEYVMSWESKIVAGPFTSLEAAHAALLILPWEACEDD